jgi:hypothetical protein
VFKSGREASVGCGYEVGGECEGACTDPFKLCRRSTSFAILEAVEIIRI